MTAALEAARRRQQADIARLSPSVPSADDPELAEHALWSDELAMDAEEGAATFEVILRAETARTELRRLADLSEQAAADYRGAIGELHERGMSYAQIGRVLGISRGTVQGHVERGRR